MKSSLSLRAWGLVAAILMLLGWYALAPAPIILMALVIAAGLVAGSLGWVLLLRAGVRFSRQVEREHFQVGEQLRERFILHNRSWLPIPWAELCDHSTLPAYHAGHALAVSACKPEHWDTRHTCLQRGVYTLGPTAIRLGDPFGLCEAVVSDRRTHTIFVYPALVHLPPLLRTRSMVSGTARPERHLLGTTANIAGVRPYIPGDPFNRIHWRSTAHRSTSEREQFSIKEFDPEPTMDVWLILDLDARVQAGRGLDATEEYAVSLAASLAYQVLRGQRAVGLIAYGAKPLLISPQKGDGQLWRLLGALAEVRATGHTSLAQVLDLAEPSIRRDTSCVVITPSCDSGWPEALPRYLGRAISLTALLLQPHSFGGTGEQEGTAARLASLGVESLILDRDMLPRLPSQDPDAETAICEAAAEEERPWATA